VHGSISIKQKAEKIMAVSGDRLIIIKNPKLQKNRLSYRIRHVKRKEAVCLLHICRTKLPTL